MSGAGQQSLWVKHIATSINAQIIPPADVRYEGLPFSNDSNYIYYVVAERGSTLGVLYQVPVLGGTPKKLLVNLDSPVTLSPDGKQVAFLRQNTGRGTELISANLDGTGERKLAERKPPESLTIGPQKPAWSPDGKIIACSVASFTGDVHHNVIGVQVEDGKEKAVGSQRWFTVQEIACHIDLIDELAEFHRTRLNEAEAALIDFPSDLVLRLFCFPFCARLGNCSSVAHASHAKVVIPVRAFLTSFVD